jgi:hypothetical protein
MLPNDHDRKTERGRPPCPVPLVASTTFDRGDRIRTGDLLLPKQARYQATLRPAVRRNLDLPWSPVNGGQVR